MNNSVFNVYPTPVYVSDVTSNINASTAGSIFSITTSVASLAVNGNAMVRISNPVGAGKNLYLINLAIATTTTSVNNTINIIRNGSFAATGTSIIPINNNTGSSNASIATVTLATTGAPTGGQTIYSVSQTLSLYTEKVNSTIAVAPGTTLLININALLALAATTSINISWIEM